MNPAKESLSSPLEPRIALREFSAGMTHSVANIFSALMMNAELGRMYVARGNLERAAVPLDRLIEDCNRASRIIGDLQRFVSAMTPLPGNATLQETLTSAISETRTTRSSYDHVRFEMALADPTVTIAAASQSAFCELLQNALQAGASVVRLVSESRDHGIALRIIDDGHGIDPAIEAKLFQPFFTTRRQQGHTGLGLSAVEHLLSALDGSVLISPRATRGVSVEVCLPFVERSAPR